MMELPLYRFFDKNMPKNAPNVLQVTTNRKKRIEFRFMFFIKCYHVRNYKRGLYMSNLIKPLISTHFFAQNYSNQIKGIALIPNESGW